MSTIKAINVQHPSSATTNLVNDSSGNVAVGNNLTVAGTSTISGNVTASGTLAVTGATTVGGVAVVAAAPTATGNIPFSTNGTTWSSTAKIVQGTAVASTSGTSIDFTSIPSWVKRVTVMFSAVSLTGTSPIQIQIGAGSVVTSGYTSGAFTVNTNNSATVTSGFIVNATTAASTAYFGHAIITSFGSNTWVESHVLGAPVGSYQCIGGGSVTLGGSLDRIRITTQGGTDTFDAGSINILYE